MMNSGSGGDHCASAAASGSVVVAESPAVTAAAPVKRPNVHLDAAAHVKVDFREILGRKYAVQCRGD
jgi:hypothetical protein